MLNIFKEVEKDKYERLIEYAYLRCDMFALRVPTSLKQDAKLYKHDYEFLEGIKRKLKIIEPYLIKKYTDIDYFCGPGDSYEVYIASLDKNLRSFFLEAGGLYNWEYPQYRPEDLWFFSNKISWMGSIAHEEMCWFYTNSTVEKDILKDVIGLEFEEDDDNEPFIIVL